MAVKQSIAFVRAKPQKISITETYHYKAQVDKYTFTSFTKADGEIKVEYIYDGELQDFRWKWKTFWKGLSDKSEGLKEIKKRIRGFFSWWILGWITKRLQLEKRIERNLLGNWDNKKHFGIAAIEDAKQSDSVMGMAHVGYLALRGYRQPNFVEDWPEYKTVRLEIPIDQLQQKLAQSQKYTLSYKYELEKLPLPPVQLSEVIVTDETPDEYSWHSSTKLSEVNIEELHSPSDEILQLRISLTTDAGQPHLDEKKRVPKELVMRWGSECGKEGNDKTEPPYQEQVRYLAQLPSVIELAEKMRELAARRGGYLLICLSESDKFEELKERAVKAAFQGISFVPVFKPYKYKDDNKQLMVVPIPGVKEYLSTSQAPPLKAFGSWDPEFDKLIEQVENLIFDERRDFDRLAEKLSALANMEGGYVLVETSSDENMKVLYQDLNKAREKCQPELPSSLLQIQHRYIPYEGKLWLPIKVKRSFSAIYSVGNTVCKWQQGEIKRVTKPDEIYDFIQQRCGAEYPVVEPMPVISYAYLEWPCFDMRHTTGIRYDPEKQRLKWTQEIRFWPIRDHKYEAMLPLIINRPVELHRQQILKGKVHIAFSEQLYSGLQVDYFNALGERRPRPQGGTPIIEKKSKIEIEFEINLREVFKGRQFVTFRKLEFEGVKLDDERLNDIQGMLADLGLENIRQGRINWGPTNFEPQSQVISQGERRIFGSLPDMQIELEIGGKSLKIKRERKKGERADTMWLETGSMYIAVTGRAKDQKRHELQFLLNRLQRLLKDRFDYVRGQVT